MKKLLWIVLAATLGLAAPAEAGFFSRSSTKSSSTKPSPSKSYSAPKQSSFFSRNTEPSKTTSSSFFKRSEPAAKPEPVKPSVPVATYKTTSKSALSVGLATAAATSAAVTVHQEMEKPAEPAYVKKSDTPKTTPTLPESRYTREYADRHDHHERKPAQVDPLVAAAAGYAVGRMTAPPTVRYAPAPQQNVQVATDPYGDAARFGESTPVAPQQHSVAKKKEDQPTKSVFVLIVGSIIFVTAFGAFWLCVWYSCSLLKNRKESEPKKPTYGIDK